LVAAPASAEVRDAASGDKVESTEPGVTMDELSVTVDSSADAIAAPPDENTIRRPMSQVIKAESSSAKKDVRRTAAQDPRVRMFASVSEMFHQPDLKSAVETALRIALHAVGSRVGMVHLLDSPRRELVVASCSGLTNGVEVGHRTPEDESTATELIMKKYVGIAIEPGAERWHLGKRWWGVTPSPGAVLGASIERHGKVFGLIEIAIDEAEGAEDETNKDALVYLAQRLGEVLSSHAKEMQALVKPPEEAK
jgi:hypothetical protein